MADGTARSTFRCSRGRLASLGRWAWPWPVIVALAALALGLGYAGFRKYMASRGQAATVLDLVYLDLQLFVLQSGVVEGAVPWELEVSRFLAPVVPAWTVLQALAVLFRDQLQALRLRRLSGHVVICGLGRKGMQLVRDFRACGDDVVVIERDERSDFLAGCRDLGALVLVGDATDRLVLRRAGADRARHVVAIAGEDGVNAEIAVRTYQLVRERPPAEGIVRCWVHIVDLKLCTLLERHRILTDTADPFEARIFNFYQTSARLLFETHPLDYLPMADGRAAHLVVVGLGQLGESVVLQAAKIGHYAGGGRLRVTVIDRAASARRRGFDSRWPQFGRIADAEFLDGDLDDPEMLGRLARWADDPATLLSVVVCLDGDARSLSCALSALARLQPRRVPIIVRMAEEAGLASLLESDEGRADRLGAVHAFGITDVVCTREALLDEQRDLLSRAIHQDFVEKRRREGRPETDPTMQPWDRLDLHLKDSNRQQADHIPVKLRAIGYVSDEPRGGEPAVTAFTDAEVEVLAQMEHARWEAERFLAGWTQGPRDPAAKQSPYLVDWKDLAEEIRKYDREAVRNLPHLVAFVGRRIYRQERRGQEPYVSGS